MKYSLSHIQYIVIALIFTLTEVILSAAEIFKGKKNLYYVDTKEIKFPE